MPLLGHLTSAIAKASCTASSASEMSPRKRESTATLRPYSRRKIVSISAFSRSAPQTGVPQWAWSWRLLVFEPITAPHRGPVPERW
jgi:hypothetical protein